MGFRFAAPADSTALLAIYGQYLDTPTTFECVLPSEEEFAGRITAFGGTYPYLVWEEDGRIRGYAYAHRQAERAAYQWNAELSVYLDRAARRRGLGRRLYGALTELLTMQGVLTAHALVTSPNPASQALHEALGFSLVAVHRLAGFKAGEWHDVLWYEKVLSPRGPDPELPVPCSALPEARVKAVLEAFSAPLGNTRKT